jgi:lipocalin-like protein
MLVRGKPPKEHAMSRATDLVGAWSLLECAEIMQDGSKRLPLGERAVGQVIYTSDGRMSAQLVRAGRAAFASDDYRGAAVEVAAEAFQQYFGYFGSYAVDAGAGTVTHFIEGAWFPNLENTAQVRTFRLDEAASSSRRRLPGVSSATHGYGPARIEGIAGTQIRRHKEWRHRPFGPPEMALYGTHKLAKTKPACRYGSY